MRSVPAILFFCVFLAHIDAVANSALAKEKYCMSCHQMVGKLVGPGFDQIAAKYIGQSNAEQYIAEKIITGGTGSFGRIPMPPSQNVSQNDAVRLARWILTSVDGPSLARAQQEQATQQARQSQADAQAANQTRSTAVAAARSETSPTREATHSRTKEKSCTSLAADIVSRHLADFVATSRDTIELYEGECRNDTQAADKVARAKKYLGMFGSPSEQQGRFATSNTTATTTADANATCINKISDSNLHFEAQRRLVSADVLASSRITFQAGSYQKQLFQGECASHPKAASYVRTGEQVMRESGAHCEQAGGGRNCGVAGSRADQANAQAADAAQAQAQRDARNLAVARQLEYDRNPSQKQQAFEQSQNTARPVTANVPGQLVRVRASEDAGPGTATECVSLKHLGQERNTVRLRMHNSCESAINARWCNKKGNECDYAGYTWGQEIAAGSYYDISYHIANHTGISYYACEVAQGNRKIRPSKQSCVWN